MRSPRGALFACAVTPMNRDVVVIGGSAGAFEVLRTMVGELPLNRRLGTTDATGRFEEKARTQRRQADVIRGILLHGAMLTPADAPKAS